ncbi:MAG: trypsin-like peptidase domain-containing protein [Lachnospiraceae bacterium]|nr:trypsin-like peptidase domain-containing protein [Lachnospiraceae bacterium]
MNRTIFFLLTILFLLTGCAPSEENTKRRPIDHEVSVDAGEYTGRGSVFLTEEDAAVIVTARHLIADAEEKGMEEFKVTFSDHTEASAKILLIDEESDLCFIVVPRGEGKALSDSVAFPEEEKTLKEEDLVFLYDGKGEKHSGYLTALKTDAAGVGRDLMSFACSVKEGMSGCGIYNANGEYVGMLIAGDDEENALGVPADRIRDIYKQERRDEE